MLDASTCLDLLCACISLIFSVKSSQQLLHFGVLQSAPDVPYVSTLQRCLRQHLQLDLTFETPRCQGRLALEDFAVLQRKASSLLVSGQPV